MTGAVIINEAFQLAADFINYTDQSIFLTGKAGTGKTTFLKFCKEHCSKNMVIVAPTGVAAVNAGGTTIHSFFQLPFIPFVPGDGNGSGINNRHTLLQQLRLTTERRETIERLELLVVDEVSMVRCDILDAIDLILRHVRRKPSKPFGGVQVLFIGDLYQLPPVIKDDQWKVLSAYYKTIYFFDSHVIQNNPPVYIELNKVYRQKEDDFIDLLNEVRHAALTEDGLALLNKRFVPSFQSSADDHYITLTTHTRKAELVNTEALKKLPGDNMTFNAFVDGEFNDDAFPADASLKIKIGAQVMFLKNDTEKIRRYYNGKIAVVDSIEDDKIIVRCDDNFIEVEKETWRNLRYSFNKTTQKIEEQELGSFMQFPLRLAWAITIHKSQGLTFDRAVVDACQSFSPGQVYVALSRCSNLDGLILRSPISKQNLFINQHIVDYVTSQKNAEQQTEFLETAKFEYQKDLLLSIFDFAELERLAKLCLNIVSEQPFYFNEEALLFCNRLCKLITDQVIVANKFCQQIENLSVENKSIEINGILQQRIISAATHFSNIFSSVKTSVELCAALSNHKPTADNFKNLLSNFYLRLCITVSDMKNCSTGFISVNLQQARKFYRTEKLSLNFYNRESVTDNQPLYTLRQLLIAKRSDLSKLHQVALSVIINNKSLDELVRYLPLTFDDLFVIKGLGEVKIKKYGGDFLKIIIPFCKEHQLESKIFEKHKQARRNKKVNV